MKVCVVGSGYVGLVTAACIADMGHRVVCVDIDAGKVACLSRGEVPIHEPGLHELMATGLADGRLRFSADWQDVPLADSVVFIAVGTPARPDGSADLSQVMAVADELGRRIAGYCVVVVKSTVPVGTGEQVQARIDRGLAVRGARIDYDVASNPEFLKEGAAINDFMRPDRVVIGTGSERARQVMADLYAPFVRNHPRVMFMGVRDAEMTKYASNAMLATKISFINEIAAICEKVGVDVEQVRLGMGADQRIGHHFIYPGCGYGGSCFPKDVRALAFLAQEAGVEPLLLSAVDRRNDVQKHSLFAKLAARWGQDMGGRRVAVWGLSFKPGTDDVREAPALALVQDLCRAGATVCAYDPVAMESARRALPAGLAEEGQLHFAPSQYAALDGADALVLVTEWKAFRRPDFAEVRRRMRGNLVIDGRNQYVIADVLAHGFEYEGIGRKGQDTGGHRAGAGPDGS